MRKRKKKNKGLFGIVGSAGEINNIMRNVKFSAVFETETQERKNTIEVVDATGLYSDDQVVSGMQRPLSKTGSNSEMRSDMANYFKKHIDKKSEESEASGGEGHILRMASVELPADLMEPETPLMGGQGFDTDPSTPTYKRQVFASVDARDHSMVESFPEVKEIQIDYSAFETKKERKLSVDDDVKKLKSQRKKGGLFKGLLSFGKKPKKKGGKKKVGKKKRTTMSPKTAGSLLGEKIFEEKEISFTVKDVQQHLKKLENASSKTNSRITEFEKKLQSFGEQMKIVIERLRRRYLTKVIDTFRSYMTIKILLTRHRLEMEEHCLFHIYRRIRFCKVAIKSSSLPAFICENFFRDVHYIALDDEKGGSLWGKIKLLESLEKVLFMKYDKMRKSFGRPKIGREGEIFLRRYILEKYEFPYNSKTDFDVVWQDDLEEKFNSIVGDKRTQTGMSIYSFLDELKDIGMARVRPKEYIRYINSVVKCMKNIYNVTSTPDLKKLRCLVHRYIFGLIARDLFAIESEKNAELDKGYNENCVLLRHFSPIQLGVPRQFLNPDGMTLAFQKAINLLRNIQYCIDPNAMLHALKLSCASIGEEARVQCLRNNESWCFGADDFFPILTYVVVQCQVRNIHSHLKYISNFAQLYTFQKDNSEVRYFLTCLDGAAEYVSDMTVERLRDLLKEKNEKLKLKNFCPYECDEEEFQRMEDCLLESLEICDGMLEECQINAQREDGEEHIDVEEMLKEVEDTDVQVDVNDLFL